MIAGPERRRQAADQCAHGDVSVMWGWSRAGLNMQWVGFWCFALQRFFSLPPSLSSLTPPGFFPLLLLRKTSITGDVSVCHCGRKWDLHLISLPSGMSYCTTVPSAFFLVFSALWRCQCCNRSMLLCRFDRVGGSVCQNFTWLYWLHSDDARELC